jgi:hypothetical protein
MKTWLRGYFLIAGILMVCLPMSAHHGNAAFSDKVTEFKNVTVTKFAWANPHCLVEFDAKDDKFAEAGRRDHHLCTYRQNGRTRGAFD